MSELAPLRLHRDQACIVCGEPGAPNPVGVAQEHEYTTTTSETFPVVQCPRCLLVYLAPRPADSELTRIYPPEYYAYHLDERDRPDRSLVERVLARRAIAALDARIQATGLRRPDDRPLRVLDVGCSTGRHLDMIRLLYPEAETHGVDVDGNAVAATRSRGHEAHHGTLEEAALPRAHFDLIFSLHVIEHVARPDRFLGHCRDLLAPGGRVLIETPNTDCLDFRLFKRRHWGGYHAPRHWYLFRRETFVHLAQRLDLDIVGSGQYTNAFFWAWTLHSLSRAVVGRRVADLLFPPVTIFFGRLYSLLLLTTLSLAETVLFKLTGRAASLWIAFAHR